MVYELYPNKAAIKFFNVLVGLEDRDRHKDLTIDNTVYRCLFIGSSTKQQEMQPLISHYKREKEAQRACLAPRLTASTWCHLLWNPGS
jgi:hypothetical protein